MSTTLPQVNSTPEPNISGVVLDLATESPETVRKCSRCRVKRTGESVDHLIKYSTCANCRSKRKVIKTKQEIVIPGLFTDFSQFLDRVKYNTAEDIHELKFRGETSADEFPRASAEEDIVPEVYNHYARRLQELYVHPMMEATGYKFAVRDYHKGGRKTKKIAFMFICSQDKGRQRKSRSTQERNVYNKLKTELCDSRLSLTYVLNDGTVNIVYTHKTHPPYGSIKHSRPNTSIPSQSTQGDITPQLPPLQIQGQRALEYNLTPLAQYNNAVQMSQMVGQHALQSSDHLQHGVDKDDDFSPYAEKAAQALAAVATSAQQQQHQGNKISVENIDKELIGLNE